MVSHTSSDIRDNKEPMFEGLLGDVCLLFATTWAGGTESSLFVETSRPRLQSCRLCGARSRSAAARGSDTATTRHLTGAAKGGYADQPRPQTPSAKKPPGFVATDINGENWQLLFPG